MDALADIWDGTSEKIAPENHGANPEDAAEDIVNEVTRIRHLRSACDWRTKGANDGHEAHQNNRFAAIGFIELVGALEMALVEEKRVFATIESGTCGATNPIADLVADDGAKHNWQQNPFQGNDARGRKNARGNQQGITREKKANKEAGFHENDQTDKQRSTGANYSFDIVDGVEQVADRFEQTGLRLTGTEMGTRLSSKMLAANQREHNVTKASHPIRYQKRAAFSPHSCHNATELPNRWIHQLERFIGHRQRPQLLEP